MHVDIFFNTDRFNLSEVKDHFENPCCFGEDLALWLCSAFDSQQFISDEPQQDDCEWSILTSVDDKMYFINIVGKADKSADNPNQGEWCIKIEKHRTIWEKIWGKNKMSRDEPAFSIISNILVQETDFKDVRYGD